MSLDKNYKNWLKMVQHWKWKLLKERVMNNYQLTISAHHWFFSDSSYNAKVILRST